MAEEALVESQISDAIALVQSLDSAGVGPSLAAWYFYDDAQEWRLIIAGPSFDALLPKQETVAYRQLAEAMSRLSLSSLTLSEVKLISTQDPLPRALRLLLRTPANALVRAYFSNTTLNGIFIKEMIILRCA